PQTTTTPAPQTTTTLAPQTTAVSSAVSPQTSRITEAEAKSIALKHAGLKESQVTFTKVKQDYDDGVSLYEIEFVTETAKYEYDVRVSDGKIVESSSEAISAPASTPSSGSIDEAEAKSIALKHVGLKESQVTFTKVKQDYDDGVSLYEIEFVTETTKYEYDVRASDGKIVESSNEAISAPASTPSSGTIDEAKAKSIALKHAGLKESQVTFKKAKLERDDGILEYEIEFYTNGMTYEYKINASTGKVLEAEIDD
ncbi:MAG: PepSY domain-containing protein, partial [Roseburia sp.]|nr:PepSY domain-containing protein [Roseburia sp.]